MSKLYTKVRPTNIKKLLRFASIGVFLSGLLGMLYVFFPLLSWEIYFVPAFAQEVAAPIPKTTVVSGDTISSLLANSFSGIDYSNAANWFPGYNSNLGSKPKASVIPNFGIDNLYEVAFGFEPRLLLYPGNQFAALL
jgi:hypothetical protein